MHPHSERPGKPNIPFIITFPIIRLNSNNGWYNWLLYARHWAKLLSCINPISTITFEKVSTLDPIQRSKISLLYFI